MRQSSSLQTTALAPRSGTILQPTKAASRPITAAHNKQHRKFCPSSRTQPKWGGRSILASLKTDVRLTPPIAKAWRHLDMSASYPYHIGRYAVAPSHVHASRHRISVHWAHVTGQLAAHRCCGRTERRCVSSGRHVLPTPFLPPARIVVAFEGQRTFNLQLSLIGSV